MKPHRVRHYLPAFALGCATMSNLIVRIPQRRQPLASMMFDRPGLLGSWLTAVGLASLEPKRGDLS
jgi:hypothetical protein